MAETIEISAEVQEWLDTRSTLLFRRMLDVTLALDRDATDVVVPYAEEATALGTDLDNADPSLAGYPQTSQTVEDLLNKYRETDTVLPAKESIAATRQIALAESFRKQLIGRRSTRAHIVQHQSQFELDRGVVDQIVSIRLLGENLA